MELKSDQRALIQLLCERGQSYADIAGLLGVEPDEIQTRARATLSQLGGGDPDSKVGLTDYMLGQADPIGRADAARFLQSDPEALELAQRIEAGIREIAPDATTPKLPEPRGARRRAAVPARDESELKTTGRGANKPVATAASSETESSDASVSEAEDHMTFGIPQTRVIAVLGLVGVILIFAVLAIAGVFSSDDESSGGSGSEATASAQQDEPITSVDLAPEGGSGVAGQADFGLVGNQQLFIDLSLEGLDPSPKKGDVYVLWLMLSDTAGYPVSQLEPDQNGSIDERYPIPSAVAATIGPQAKLVEVSQGSSKELQGLIDKAIEEGAPLAPFSGTVLAKGEIPLVEGGDATGGGDSGDSGSGLGTGGSAGGGQGQGAGGNGG